MRPLPYTAFSAESERVKRQGESKDLAHVRCEDEGRRKGQGEGKGAH